MRRLRLLAVLALLVSGCAGAGSAPRAETAAEPPPCRPGHGAPITERALKDALAAQAIRMYRDEDCFGSELVLLSNITDAVPPERENDLLASEGQIFCEVHAAGAPSGRIDRYVWRNDPEPTYVEVLNVSCAIYPQTKRQTDKLERALRRLPGVSSRPTRVPSPDAMRD